MKEVVARGSRGVPRKARERANRALLQLQLRCVDARVGDRDPFAVGEPHRYAILAHVLGRIDESDAQPVQVLARQAGEHKLHLSLFFAKNQAIPFFRVSFFACFSEK